MSPSARSIETIARRRRRPRRRGAAHRRHGAAPGKPGQSHDPDRPHRRPAGRATSPNCSWSARIAAAPSSRRARCSRLPDRPAAPRQQPQPYLPRRRRRHRRAGDDQDSVDRPARRPGLLRRFMMEEWVARRIDSAHVLKPRPRSRQRKHLYRRHRIYRRADARPMDGRQSAARSRDRALHRRPDRRRPAGVSPQGDAAPGPAAREHHDRQDGHGEDHRFRCHRGAVAGSAPPARRPDGAGDHAIRRAGIFPRRDRHDALRHLFAGHDRLSHDHGTPALWRADGAGAHAPGATQGGISPGWITRAAVPDWVDAALRRAVHPDPARRQETVSEFIADLRHPNPAYARPGRYRWWNATRRGSGSASPRCLHVRWSGCWRIRCAPERGQPSPPRASATHDTSLWV